jgi:phosphatidylglycerol---prolipoprotein diacylglyceryl transferase
MQLKPERTASSEKGSKLPAPPLPPAAVHGFFVLAGTAAAVGMFLSEARRRGRLGDETVAVLLGGLICGGFFARLSTLWRYLEIDPSPSLAGALLRGGQSVLGGLAGAYAGVLLTKRWIGYRQPTGDVFAPAVALGLGIGRFGCLLTEPPGRPTGLPWGVTFSATRAAAFPQFPARWVGVPLHPSFAYEIAFHLAAFWLLLRLRGRPELTGKLFRLYLLSYAVFRLAVEQLRANPVVAWGLTFSQLFLLPSILLLAVSLLRERRREPPFAREVIDARG